MNLAIGKLSHIYAKNADIDGIIGCPILRSARCASPELCGRQLTRKDCLEMVMKFFIKGKGVNEMKTITIEYSEELGHTNIQLNNLDAATAITLLNMAVGKIIADMQASATIKMRPLSQKGNN